MTNPITFRAGHLGPTLAVTAALVLMGIGAAAAQAFPTPDGPNERDHVTGYLCASVGCDTVRMPNANCICQKMNPAEQDLSRLRLKCSTTENGRWVACPVKPRHGIAVN